MREIKKQKFGLLLVLMMIICNACSTTESYNVCPVWPVGGKPIGDVYRKLSTEDRVAFNEWANRLNKLRQELELCKGGGE